MKTKTSLLICGLAILLSGCVSPNKQTPSSQTTTEVRLKYFHVSSEAEAQHIVTSYIQKGYRDVAHLTFPFTPGEATIEYFYGANQLPPWYLVSRDGDFREAYNYIDSHGNGASIAVINRHPDGIVKVQRPAIYAFSTGENATTYYKMVPTQVQRTAFDVEYLALP
jgi:hypothetical protein